MNRLENRLRDAFRADAHTVKPESIPAFTGVPTRPAARRARVLVPVAAAIATAAIAAGVSVWGTSSLQHGRTVHHGGVTSPSHQTPLPLPVVGENGQQAPRAVPASAPAPGVPQFFVTDEPANVPDANQLVVRDTASGKIVGRVVPPRGKFFGSVTATAGDRTFVTTVTPTIANGPCAQQLYRFQLSGKGQPGRLVALHVSVPGTFNETDTLAITPDGRTIAYETYMCGQDRSEYGVIDLATRQVRVWSATGLEEAPSSGAFPVGLSLSANGRLLAFAEVGGPARVLRTRAPAGSILARSRVLSRDSDWVALAGDGSAFYGCTLSPHSLPLPQKGSLTYFWQPIGSAHRHVIASWPNLSAPECMASLDPSGNYLLMQFPTTKKSLRPVILDLRSGRTTSVGAAGYYAPLTVAW